ncbi:MAG: HindIII family type II restriction endonuclease [Synergistaceae bacterium]|nr:HindIII family type II restriction endonuclease [Synergistaceae bacterium]
MFSDILGVIRDSEDRNFDETCGMLEACVNSDKAFIDTLRQIGIIPESIAHDSTGEKLFSKASDIVLSRAFRELGLKSTVLHERADSADVIAESKLYGYALVADAKAFRLSRTAKNQKDFKVSALSAWRKDNDYAVLCSPYFHYPAKASQIYAQALTHNVCLLSWEHIIFLLENRITESQELDLSAIWGFSGEFSHKVLVSDMKKNFMLEFNSFLAGFLNIGGEMCDASLKEQVSHITARGVQEKSFWLETVGRIRNYSREQAVNELISSLKINEKLSQIDAFIRSIS